MNKDSVELKLELKYQEIILLWERFCRLHSELYDLTCDEYLALLSSDIERIESIREEKENTIGLVRHVEQERRQIIEELNSMQIFNTPIQNVSDLLFHMKSFEKNNNAEHLSKLNALLIEIIQKIQDQNKKNQIFLNKAILSLKEIKEGFSGTPKFKVYNGQGMTGNSTVK